MKNWNATRKPKTTGTRGPACLRRRRKRLLSLFTTKTLSINMIRTPHDQDSQNTMINVTAAWSLGSWKPATTSPLLK